MLLKQAASLQLSRNFCFFKFSHEVVNALIEHGASVLVKSKRSNKTPRDLRKAQSRPGRRGSAHDLRQCPAAAARSRFAIFGWQKEDSMHEPTIEKSQHNVVVENLEYWVCESVKDGAKHLQCSETKFSGPCQPALRNTLVPKPHCKGCSKPRECGSG